MERDEGIYMAGITLEKGSIIYDYGQPMTALHLITDGRITVAYPGGGRNRCL